MERTFSIRGYRGTNNTVRIIKAKWAKEALGLFLTTYFPKSELLSPLQDEPAYNGRKVWSGYAQEGTRQTKWWVYEE